MSYRLKIDPKSRKASRFIATVQREIQNAYVASGKKKIDIARILGVDKSDVHRRLKESSNLTARSIGEMAYALDVDIKFCMVPSKDRARESNAAPAAPAAPAVSNASSPVVPDEMRGPASPMITVIAAS
ncbi:hypothetical protein LWC05_05570 [Acetobacter sicerae]|uniref:HTH cro/C1-type domain-containing protein n=1 Tax=Acetobacter sicerae TaxID=85325 RepID=A0ABS8VWA7_9PROT|nr:hypothetical protein [Acetobacter sicerae]MCE0743360.1 hypothetical protein [Acetobacter sicerae]